MVPNELQAPAWKKLQSTTIRGDDAWLLVGTVNKRRILEFKRTQDFTIEDFGLLERPIAWFGRLHATPHVLSQVSDLTNLPSKELRKIRQLFRWVVEHKIEESYD